ATDLIFTDDNISIPLTVASTSINSDLSQGIIDAINDVYAIQTGGSASLWIRSNSVLRAGEACNDLAIGGTSTASAKFHVFATGSIAVIFKDRRATLSAALASDTPLTNQGATGQTAPLQTWQDISSNNLASIASDGSFVSESTLTGDSLFIRDTAEDHTM